MSHEIHEIALGALGHRRGMRQRSVLETSEHLGQISGSIDANETLMRQHVKADPSVFVVNELVASKETLQSRQVPAWALKLARDEISRAICVSDSGARRDLEARLAVYNAALASSHIKRALAGRIGSYRPRHSVISGARQSRSALHPKSGDVIRVYEGLRRLAPFALRRIVLDAVLGRTGEQRLLELAAGLSLAQALSIVSGHPMVWNLSAEQDGIIAKVGFFTVGWNTPVHLDAEDPRIVCVQDGHSGSYLAFLRCAQVLSADFESEAIRLATESLVAECRKEAKKGPRFEETPLANCAVVSFRFLKFDPGEPKVNQLIAADFDDIGRGRLVELARRTCRRSSLS
ncbi:hypothetical protein [Variovorax sp. dw_954]|uniref:hypothetical protein n=1 Tax=Variovorax sp. dw_954 TaxID=2720078 RepID=UPI001BD36B19|nr:hypothetical protein [Variovorax sp. dw_954]